MSILLRTLLISCALTVFAFEMAYRPVGALAAEKGAPPSAAATPGAVSGAAVPATPKAASTAESTPKMSAEAREGTCKKAVANFANGDLAGLDLLAPGRRDEMLRNQQAARIFICLAIATDDAKYCDPLPKEGKGYCLEQLQNAREWKGVPKEQLKAHVIHRACLEQNSKENCATALDAMISGDASKCQKLTKVNEKVFCSALVVGDSTKCGPLKDETERAYCEAVVAEDPNRCAKDSQDCRNMAGIFAAFRKDGLNGVQDIDPLLATVGRGSQACTPLLGDLDRFCSPLGPPTTPAHP